MQYLFLPNLSDIVDFYDETEFFYYPEKGSAFMVQNIGINILIPMAIFLTLIVGSLAMSGSALADVQGRRNKK